MPTRLRREGMAHGLWIGVLLVGLGCKENRPASSPAARSEPGASGQVTEAAGAGEQVPPHGARPNVIVVLVDTLRADCLGTYGHAGRLTPNLDAFAAEGLVVERAMAAAPWTQPSVASVFASVYPGVHRVANYGEAMAQAYGGQPKVAVFAERFVTLAERLQAAGYATAAASANPFILPEFGFGQGFDHFDARVVGNDVDGAVVNQSALDWLRQRPADKPFFLYLHYMDVHGPYPTDPALLGPLLDAVEVMPNKHALSPGVLDRLGYLGQLPPNTPDRARHEQLRIYREYWVARYDAGVKLFDRHFAELRDALKGLNLWDSSCILVFADHGEQLGEKGEWNHGDSVWQTELHVPLLLRWPGHLPAGRRVPQLVSLIDVAPTLYDLLDLPDAEHAQGRSLLPLLEESPTAQSPRYVMAEAVKKPPEQKALLLGRWKLIQYFDTGRHALYDLVADPQEEHDLAAAQPKRADALQELLDKQLAENLSMSQGQSVQAVELTPEQAQRLRALGYLGD